MIHFGESTRKYVIRERPQAMTSALEDGGTDEVEGGLLGLPETETELDVSILSSFGKRLSCSSSCNRNKETTGHS